VASWLRDSLQIAVLVLFRGPEWWRMSPEEEPLHLGYLGPTRVRELEVLEPNSVQAWFYQKSREGRSRAIEYRVVQPLDLTPGPEALPQARDVPVERPPEPQAEPVDSPEVVEPLLAFHREPPLSSDYEIVTLVKPIYPEPELQRQVGGSILLGAYATLAGEFEDAVVLEAVADPPTASSRSFELACLEALRQWWVRLVSARARERAGTWTYFRFEFDPEKGVLFGTEAEPAPEE
jgi:hypothetical protein